MTISTLWYALCTAAMPQLIYVHLLGKEVIMLREVLKLLPYAGQCSSCYGNWSG